MPEMEKLCIRRMTQLMKTRAVETCRFIVIVQCLTSFLICNKPCSNEPLRHYEGKRNWNAKEQIGYWKWAYTCRHVCRGGMVGLQ